MSKDVLSLAETLAAITGNKVGAGHVHWCQLNVSWAVKTAAIQTKPAYASYQILDFSLVRAGGLSFCRR
jgi:hypothetical protein